MHVIITGFTILYPRRFVAVARRKEQSLEMSNQERRTAFISTLLQRAVSETSAINADRWTLK